MNPMIPPHELPAGAVPVYINGYSDPDQFISIELMVEMRKEMDNALDKLMEDMTDQFANANPNIDRRIIDSALLARVQEYFDL